MWQNIKLYNNMYYKYYIILQNSNINKIVRSTFQNFFVLLYLQIDYRDCKCRI